MIGIGTKGRLDDNADADDDSNGTPDVEDAFPLDPPQRPRIKTITESAIFRSRPATTVTLDRLRAIRSVRFQRDRLFSTHVRLAGLCAVAAVKFGARYRLGDCRPVSQSNSSIAPRSSIGRTVRWNYPLNSVYWFSSQEPGRPALCPRVRHCSGDDRPVRIDRC